MKHLSRVRLGISMGLLEDFNLSTVQRLFLDVQPGHLKATDIDPSDRKPGSGAGTMDDQTIRLHRAGLVRKALG